jgi:AraC family transcriptional regulator
VDFAKKLLVDTQRSVQEIALQVGCASARHFGAIFRTAVGETPTAWRRARGK